MNFKQKIEEKVKDLKHKLTAIFLAYKRKETPLLAKLIAFFTIAYALSPIDLIPDFIPLLGYLDDIIILPLLITICIKLIPQSILIECEQESKNMWKNGKPKKWYYAIPIIIIWISVTGIIVYTIISKL